jgi:uncharacterized protein YeaO (DUF488 family)
VEIDLWEKEIAPSAELRKWFKHDKDKWDEFKNRYFKELGKKVKIMNFLATKARTNRVTFLYSAKNEKFNNAIALKEYVDMKKK